MHFSRVIQTQETVKSFQNFFFLILILQSLSTATFYQIIVF